MCARTTARRMLWPLPLLTWLLCAGPPPATAIQRVCTEPDPVSQVTRSIAGVDFTFTQPPQPGRLCYSYSKAAGPWGTLACAYDDTGESVPLNADVRKIDSWKTSDKRCFDVRAPSADTSLTCTFHAGTITVPLRALAPDAPLVHSCETQFGGSRYRLFGVERTRAEAAEACAAQGPGWRLARARSPQQLDDLRDTDGHLYGLVGTSPVSIFWLGATRADADSPWLEADGSPFCPENAGGWCPTYSAQGGHNCVLYNQWCGSFDNLTPCTDARRFICEHRADDHPLGCDGEPVSPPPPPATPFPAPPISPPPAPIPQQQECREAAGAGEAAGDAAGYACEAAFLGSTYRFFAAPQTFPAAQATCGAQGSGWRLVVLESELERDTIRLTAPGAAAAAGDWAFWVGGARSTSADPWLQEDGSAFCPEAGGGWCWAYGADQGHCAYHSDWCGGLVNVDPCASSKPVVCERDPGYGSRGCAPPPPAPPPPAPPPPARIELGARAAEALPRSGAGPVDEQKGVRRSSRTTNLVTPLIVAGSLAGVLFALAMLYARMLQNEAAPADDCPSLSATLEADQYPLGRLGESSSFSKGSGQRALVGEVGCDELSSHPTMAPDRDVGAGSDHRVSTANPLLSSFGAAAPADHQGHASGLQP